MLAVISIISMVVAGIGITNMMLASISEKIYEIGLRKAIGASDRNMFSLFLLESVMLCLISGIIGILLGFALYELMIYIASEFVPSIHFTWIYSPLAILLATVSIVGVGVLSGILPARKASTLDVVKCLSH